MIKAIFYGRFDTQEGPKVVHQVPDGAIVPSPTASPQQAPFFTFSDISFFVIPRQELCGNLLQVCTNGYRILGYPICMKSAQYDRNEFIFNFCFVLAEEEDFSKYKSIVQKLADLMHGLEEQSCFLSRDFSKSGEGKVYSLCETLMEDLNSYSECMIPIDKLNTLNFKLFPVYPAPPHVKAWDVPLFTVRYEAFLDENWDLTLQKIVPYINGVNSVRIISILADVELSLAYKAIRHLIYYGCVFLLDIFSFSAIYAPTASFHSSIASDEGMQQECARYVNTRFAPTSSLRMAPVSPSSSDYRGDLSGSHHRLEDMDDNIWPIIGDTDDDDVHSNNYNTHRNKGGSSFLSETRQRPRKKRKHLDGVGIVELYASLRQGQSVKQWYTLYARQLGNVDIRRFITFGIIKGFLYRVHKYAYGPRPEGFVYTSSHADIKSLSKASSVKGGISIGSGLGSSMNSAGGATTAGEDALVSRESSIRYGRIDDQQQQQAGAMSGSYQSTNNTHSNRSHNSHSHTNSSNNIRLGSAGTSSFDHNNNHPLHHHHDDQQNSENHSTASEDLDIMDGEESKEREGGTAQEAIRFHQNLKVLEKYLDGQHCFDEICTELEISERELTARLRMVPWVVHIIHR
ncbi:nitrogen permease regulator Npr2, putative [Talaromyces stipitatus ATCC 10500]|uniref:Nitrogen permease regulator Npr2, putative n=1 Tax=Talaromyces stipitatus (strain ATCC 10500 / CBS 375.48 / QM 6759 / NRRL 1006) TaxID=441959 RepID=B8MGP4_TALSN|nr:nitrogen permease regulator Npr2, putative [Talaromyces stipitatus ATCC 10500]EED16795.1 nitrogen permease regulator Npr2, putative [Talaromyces stipitatus ATCC 10500]